MRSQKLKAQIYAQCESGHLCAGGGETESLVIPRLYNTAVMVLAEPMLEERQALA